MTRTDVRAGDAIPQEIAQAMREDLKVFGLDWDQFCSIDHGGCTPTQARQDLLGYLSRQPKP